MKGVTGILTGSLGRVGSSIIRQAYQFNILILTENMPTVTSVAGNGRVRDRTVVVAILVALVWLIFANSGIALPSILYVFPGPLLFLLLLTLAYRFLRRWNNF